MVYSSTVFENILDSCIDALQEERNSIEDCLANYSRYREELEPLLSLAVRLQSGRALTAPSEFRQVAGLRMRNLIAAHPRRKTQNARFLDLARIRKGIETQLRTRLNVLVFTLLLAVAIVASGVYFASAKALPGEDFYPAKMTIERIRVDLSQTQSNEAQLHLAFANRRIDETTSLVEESKTENVPGALSGYTNEVKAAQTIVNEGEKLTSEERVFLVNSIIENLTGHEQTLSKLLERVPEASRQAIQLALELSREERAQAMKVLRQLKDGAPGSPGHPTSESTPAPGVGSDDLTSTPTTTPTPTPQPSELPASRPTDCAGNCPTSTATPTPRRVKTRIVAPALETELASERPRIWATIRPTIFPKIWETVFPTSWPTPDPDDDWQDPETTAQPPFWPPEIPVPTGFPTEWFDPDSWPKWP